MNEENSNLTAQNPEEWQAPPQDLKPLQEPPQMSEAATLGSIFLNPEEHLKICAANRDLF
ncbi:MAG: hypothetical protein WKF71_13220 [Pyrinomonadaceae bacterium]